MGLTVDLERLGPSRRTTVADSDSSALFGHCVTHVPHNLTVNAPNDHLPRDRRQRESCVQSTVDILQWNVRDQLKYDQLYGVTFLFSFRKDGVFIMNNLSPTSVHVHVRYWISPAYRTNVNVTLMLLLYLYQFK